MNSCRSVLLLKCVEIGEQIGDIVIFEYEGVNGVVIDGAEFFLIRDGLICEQQVFFDTGPLLRGRS